MAQQDIFLSGTEHEQQKREFLCGAASVNMILSFWDKQQPQDDVWSAIQQNTGATARPNNAIVDEGTFWNQQCDPCLQGGYDCWYTTPEAMAHTLRDFGPGLFAAEYHTTEDAIRRIAACLSAFGGRPAAYTKAAQLHWTVAVGYQLNGPGPGIVWNGNTITALYSRDPATEDQGVITLTTVHGFMAPVDGLLMAVNCGPRRGSYPIVVDQFSKGDFVTRMITTVWLRVSTRFPLVDWKRWIPRKPPRPLPPPPP
jgi:hypothetical protein